MNLLHDAYVALLSGLTYKTKNEIHWYNEYGEPITIEPINIQKGKYIIRRYFNNGNKSHEIEYENNLKHGKYIEWYKDSNRKEEVEYRNGIVNGKYIVWYENGNKKWELEYKDCKSHGKSIGWHENGIKKVEVEYRNGVVNGKCIRWDIHGKESSCKLQQQSK